MTSAKWPCGRLPSSDRTYLARYALSAAAATPVNVPVVLGVQWHVAFDTPVWREGAYWIGLEKDWREIRGGHAVCLRPARRTDLWQRRYDQGQTLHCVGFAWSRCMSLLNRKMYDGHALFADADRLDGIAGSDGTTVQAGGKALQTIGAYPLRGGSTYGPFLRDGIAEYRWSTSATQIATTLGLPWSQTYVEVLNSWSGYPTVRLPLSALQELLDDGADACVPTDR